MQIPIWLGIYQTAPSRLPDRKYSTAAAATIYSLGLEVHTAAAALLPSIFFSLLYSQKLGSLVALARA
jgi:hypothetical protein